jgi:hypothetical protein
MKKSTQKIVILLFILLGVSSSMAADLPFDVRKPCLVDEPAKVHGNLSNEEKPPYKDAGLSIEERVADLVSCMTLKEKIAVGIRGLSYYK